VYDPWADPEEARHEYGLDLIDAPETGAYDGVMVAVAHKEFCEKGAATIAASVKPDHVVYDLKNVLPREAGAIRL
jgi:UDP-N-acetyl-D-galactosamine dehydrogenase